MPFDFQFPSLSILDVLDISIFAVAVYVLLAIEIQRGSRRGIAVIGVFATIYVLAWDKKGQDRKAPDPYYFPRCSNASPS